MNEENVLSVDFSMYAGYSSEETSSYDECSSTDQEHWDDDDIEELLKDFEMSEDDIATSSDGDSSSDSALIHVVLLFLFLWSSFYGISATALNHLIQFFHYLFVTISKRSFNLSALATLFPTSLYKA